MKGNWSDGVFTCIIPGINKCTMQQSLAVMYSSLCSSVYGLPDPIKTQLISLLKNHKIKMKVIRTTRLFRPIHIHGRAGTGENKLIRDPTRTG